jgi:hypothetical protein
VSKRPKLEDIVPGSLIFLRETWSWWPVNGDVYKNLESRSASDIFALVISVKRNEEQEQREIGTRVIKFYSYTCILSGIGKSTRLQKYYQHPTGMFKVRLMAPDHLYIEIISKP